MGILGDHLDRVGCEHQHPHDRPPEPRAGRRDSRADQHRLLGHSRRTGHAIDDERREVAICPHRCKHAFRQAHAEQPELDLRSVGAPL